MLLFTVYKYWELMHMVICYLHILGTYSYGYVTCTCLGRHSRGFRNALVSERLNISMTCGLTVVGSAFDLHCCS
jgi:hypothetical protein